MLTKTLLSAGIAAGLMLSAQPAAAHSAPAQAANAMAANPVAANPVAANPMAANPMAAQRLVHYDDLDLASAKGRAILAARLRHAARAVCDTSYGVHPLIEVMEARRCYRSALQSAQREVASLSNPRIVSR